jgi:hypothetical protein
MPLSDIVRVGFSPSAKSRLTFGSKAKDLNVLFVSVKYLNLSNASDELDMSSRRKISFRE